MGIGNRRGVRQIVGEVVSGSTTTFTLAYLPVSGSLEVFGGPARLKEGATVGGYSLSGQIITPTESYSAGEIMANYRF
jgi:hypothetical protein